MNDVIMSNLKEYVSKNRSSAFALRDWVSLNAKKFSFTDALECIYLEAGGHHDEMTKIIKQLTEKKKVLGRTQVYNPEETKQIDIVAGEDGKLKLKGYDPDKEPTPKGQHLPRNPKIFRQGDGQTNKIFQAAEKRMMGLGQRVRELYPDGDNMYITHAMQAIRRYAAEKKVSADAIVNAIKAGRLKLKDEEYNSFEVVPSTTNESRVIVISEAVASLIKEEYDMTEYKFNNNVRKFLSDLLADPVNATPTDFLRQNGITRSMLIRQMEKIGMVERDDKISDSDENGQPKTATMMVKYKVPRKNFERKLKKLWIRMVDRNLPERKHGGLVIKEDGEGGATSAVSSGEFVQPAFPVQRRKMYGESDVDEATATTTVGNYEYDAPIMGDEETLSRKNGVGGSVSVNKM